MGATHPVKSLRDLVDPRLGLPAEEEKCLTCGGTTYENCTGWNQNLPLSAILISIFPVAFLPFAYSCPSIHKNHAAIAMLKLLTVNFLFVVTSPTRMHDLKIET